MRWLLYLHFALWSSLFAVFVWISAPIVASAIRENQIGPIEANHSIDAYLRALTGIEHSSEKLPDIFRRLDKQGPLIIFVGDENSQSEFLGMAIHDTSRISSNCPFLFRDSGSLDYEGS